MIPIILAGGTGTRLWPLSRHDRPKPFHELGFGESLFYQTLKRAGELVPGVEPIIVCHRDHRFLIAEQLRLYGERKAALLLEPDARDTAAAIAAAAFFVRERRAEEGDGLLILPADHHIEDHEAFAAAFARARALCRDGKMVTFGVPPARAEANYGYIRAGRELDGGYEVAEFVEKPDLAQAGRYLERGGYYWNSGMFVFGAQDYLNELEALAPDLYADCRQAVAQGEEDMGFFRLQPQAYSRMDAVSVDYCVMEKTRRAAVVPLEKSGWTDVGSWSVLWEIGDKDEDGNVRAGDVVAHDVQNSYLHATSRLLAVTGLSDAVVVEHPDAVLVTSRARAANVKELVRQLRELSRNEASFHNRVYRPWGFFQDLLSGERFRVKLISVAPGHRLSLQMHHQRSEHWVVVRGSARVIRGEEELELHETESVYIPLGCHHRLSNAGEGTLEIIEVQSGQYLGEDDIVRLEDDYGRKKER